MVLQTLAAPGRSPPSGWRATSRRRCARRRSTRTGSSRTRLRGRGQALRDRPAEHERLPADFEPFAAAGRGGRAAQRARPAAAQAHRRPACSDVYQGDELESSTSSTPTTAARSTGTCGGSPLAALRGGAERRRARPSSSTCIWKGLDLRRRRPAAFAGVYDPIDAGPGVCAYARGARRRWPWPRCATGRAAGWHSGPGSPGAGATC